MMLRVSWIVRMGNAFFSGENIYTQDKKKAVETYEPHTEERI